MENSGKIGAIILLIINIYGYCQQPVCDIRQGTKHSWPLGSWDTQPAPRNFPCASELGTQDTMRLAPSAVCASCKEGLSVSAVFQSVPAPRTFISNFIPVTDCLSYVLADLSLSTQCSRYEGGSS